MTYFSIFLTKTQNHYYHKILFLYAKVDCEWEEWNIGYCSKSCGGGTRINYREKIIDEEFGGICAGESDMEEVCNTHECPGKLEKGI